MREMKDSGIPWIGSIPSEWKVLKVKNIARRKTDKNMPDEQVLSLYRELGIVIKSERDDNHNVTSENTDNYKFVEINDLVVNKMKAWQGSIAVSGYQGIVSPAYYVYRFTDNMCFPWYVHYVLRSVAYLPEYRRLSGGIRIGQWDLSDDNFKNIPLPIPNSIAEQRKIVNYLDSKCAKIDAIIEKQKVIIEKLKEYKLSIISEAVARGINPDAELKDSNNQIFGKIPANYELRKLKFLCSKISDGTHFSPETVDEGYPYITAADIHGKGIDYSATKKVSEKEYKALVEQGCRPVKGDVLIVKDGATTGRVGLMTDDMECVLLSSVAMLHPVDDVDSEYLMYLMMSNEMQQQIIVSMAGSAMPRTTLTKLMEYVGVYMPLGEQKKVVEYLNQRTEIIEIRIADKEKMLLKLQEYKKSLIYEVVTGKKEV